MSLEDIVSATRSAASLFDMSHRGLLEVRGEDRVRWLDGMISGDVQALEAGEIGAGCYATLLTNRGAIVADLHVARFEDAYLLESLGSEIPRIRETLERYVIADDVSLSDRSAEFSNLGLEGPQASAIVSHATSGSFGALPSEHWGQTTIAERVVLVAAFGFTGEPAYQLRVRPEDREAVVAALETTAAATGLVRGDREALEVLRVEAGIPALGAELDEEVLPPEARLEHAISTTKGCYIGQEIVARLRARGQVNHLLVGFRIDAPSLPVPGTPVSAGGRETGEMTSIVRSPSEGPIALGYVRREHAEVGTEIEFEGGRADIAALPFVTGTAPPVTTSGEA
jgi:folate-binding protein YgfZ